MTQIPTLDDIATALSARQAQQIDDGRSRAAVAIILRHSNPARVLIVQRARRDGDPWSGDLAFPGGHIEPGDADDRSAAERETLEEVGLDLSTARCLGQLDDRQARVRPMTICAFVYAVEAVPDLTLSCEIDRCLWVSLADLLDPQRRCIHERVEETGNVQLPALDLLGPGHPLLWGVTYAFLQRLLDTVGQPLPPPPSIPVGT